MKVRKLKVRKTRSPETSHRKARTPFPELPKITVADNIGEHITDSEYAETNHEITRKF